jgi:hypothetical protein
MDTKTRQALAHNEFAFYLDAWLYCVKNNIQLDAIRRRNWDIWEVVTD